MNKEKLIPAFNKIKEYGQADAVHHCGDFVNQINCVECGTAHFGGFTTCKNRWCFNCQHKRLLCWMAKLIPFFKDWYAKGNYISNLNFTVRDGSDLKETLGRLEGSYRKLYNTPKRRNYWYERFPGGIRSLEVKLGKNSGLWHPHYHCLVMQEAGEFVKDYDWLSEDWHNIVGYKMNPSILLSDGSWVDIAEPTTRKDGTSDCNWNGNVFITKVKQYQSKSRNKRGSTDGVMAAVCETLKYIVKVTETEEDEESGFKKNRNILDDKALFSEAFYNLKGKRQVSTWGLIYGLEAEVDEAFEKEDYQQLKDFVCQQCGCTEGELIEVLYSSIKNNVLYDINKSYGNKNNKKRLSVASESQIEINADKASQ